MSDVQPVLIAGTWRAADAEGTFEPKNPAIKEPTGEVYPVSTLKDVEEAIEAAAVAAEQIAEMGDEIVASFMERFAERIEARADELVAMANAESGLPASPRLADIELPRTTDQLRQAATAARNRSWTMPNIDTGSNIRSLYGALGGGVAVFGPNNFPFAFNSVAGGDFAAAIAAGNPVIGKGNSSHPGTSRLLAEEALGAAEDTGMPAATVQLIYRTNHEVGARLVSHPKIGATGYTGSRGAGLVLKETADKAGKPIYMELSSINPVVILPGALAERGEEIADEFATSCLMGTGQFCTNPGILLLLKGERADAFLVDPGILGPPPEVLVQDRFAADHLVSVAAGIVREVSRMRRAADEAGQRLLTFTVEADVGFATPQHLEDFSRELTEAVAVAMEMLYMAVDVEYGDWPFAHKLAETIRRLCDEGGLVEESEEHELHWKLIEANQMGGTQERVEAYERWRSSRPALVQDD